VVGGEDDEIRERARREHRILLTRDRELAGRTPGALWIASPGIGPQLRAVHEAFPQFPFEVRFDRCTACNGPLRPWSPAAGADWPEGVPREMREGRRPGGVYRCAACGHSFWEGSHTTRIRRDVAAWVGGGP
jgi:hypothetical protein